VTRISVVVPIYNVETYLEPCLRSIAAQTFGDLEVIMVDDGSTDGSGRIAEAFASGDERFRLVRQANGGLSAARNTGIEEAGGEFLAFADSDDVLPADAYERLLGALDDTGSDFATGNVHRLEGAATMQAPFLARTFARTRLRTHVTRFRPLLADRTAWNKLYRRSFWDRHGHRFPEGRLYEDIPVMLPLHFQARSVDVIADPVYYWRVRAQSITQRRLERRALLDRLAAIEEVRDHLARHGPRRGLRWYEQSAVADDLRLYLDLLDEADDDYRALFLERAGAFARRAGRSAQRKLPAIDRLKWHLVLERRLPELLEVLRFQKHDLPGTPPVRIRGRWYGDYPFRDDPELRIPRRVYRLGRGDLDLALTASVDRVEADGGRVRLQGRASIDALGPRPARRVRVVAVRPGRWQRLRGRVGAVHLATTATDAQGYEATLDPRALGRSEGAWELIVHVRAGGLSRRRSRFALGAPRELLAADLQAGDAMLTVAAVESGKIVVRLRREWLAVRRLRLDGGVVELEGDLRLVGGGPPALELRREADSHTVAHPLEVDGRTWTARIPLDEAGAVWELWARIGARRIPLAALGAHEHLARSRQGGAALARS
jgi:CDP-glycerol glycerophosphotransferase